MDDSGLDLVFPAVDGKQVAVRFDRGDLTSDAGLVLLRQADRRIGLTGSMRAAAKDRRQRSKVAHTFSEMLRDRVRAGIAQAR